MTAEPLTPEQRVMRSRLAAFARWGNNVDDRAATTKPGTDGLLAKFEREIDPDGQLDPQTPTTAGVDGPAGAHAAARARIQQGTQGEEGHDPLI